MTRKTKTPKPVRTWLPLMDNGQIDWEPITAKKDAEMLFAAPCVRVIIRPAPKRVLMDETFDADATWDDLSHAVEPVLARYEGKRLRIIVEEI